MEPRQRVNQATEMLMLLLAATIDSLHIILGAIQIVPLLSIVILPIQLILSLFAFMGFSIWFIASGIGFGERFSARVTLFLFTTFIAPWLSFIPLVGFILAFFSTTVFVFLTLRTVKKEDEEYNKEQGA